MPEFDEPQGFKLRSQGMPFKEIGSSNVDAVPADASPLTHPKGGKEHKHLFQKLHPKGKKFWDTKLGEGISNIKEKYVDKKIRKKLTKSEADDVVVPGTSNLEVHESSYDYGTDKPVLKPSSRKSTSYNVPGGKGYTFVRGGGDPYQYRSLDKGETFQYKKIGEQGWSDVKGGFDYIKQSYTESIDQDKEK